MQKKLIALAIAGAIAAPAAMAADDGVTIYGQLDMSYDSIRTNAASGTGNADGTLNRISSNASRIGFKGKEDLGNGNFASWQIEQQIDMDGANSNSTIGATGASSYGSPAGNTWATRNTFVGLGGGWGEVRMGYHDTPHKMSTAPLDIFADTAGDYNNVIGNANGSVVFDNRLKNAIAYISPNFSGLTVALATGTQNEIGTQGNPDPKAVSFGAMYSNGPIYVGYGYEKLTNNALIANTTDATDNKLGVGYSFDMGKVAVVYDKMSTSGGTAGGQTAADRSAWYLNGQINAGVGAVKLAYGKMNNGKVANADTGAKWWAIGYDYPMSKRTKLYAVYTKTTNNSGATYAVGSKVGSYYAPGAGEDPSTVSLGIRHSF